MLRQTIKLDARLRELVLSGAKTRTMRSGRREYAGGPASFEIVENGKETGEAIPVVIEFVVYKAFGAITDEDAKFEGYKKASELQEALLHYYPTLSADDTVTVVGFRKAGC